MLVPFREDTVGHVDNLSEDLILHSIPKSYRGKAMAILQYIKGHISWDDKGETVFHGQNFPGTHIADLIRYSVREYGKAPPIGYEEFQEILSKLNIPKGLVQQVKSFLPKKVIPAEKVSKGWVKI